jgi:4-hydroxy-4-methyl-2-oxoglutarate aldolase
MPPSNSASPQPNRLSHGDLLALKRLNTPTVYNGWEQITSHNRAAEGINLEETHDFMPQMGPMVGYAVTLVIEPSNPEHRQRNPAARSAYRRYLVGEPGPKIVVVQDLDKPRVIGSWWGEVNANLHRALGCVGTITDGAVRDLDEMTNAGFKALARRLCVGHAHVWPVRWGVEVSVFGQRVLPGQLIHADKHGFLVIPSEDESRLLEAARFMDANECNTIIAAARSTAGLPASEVLDRLEAAQAEFVQATRRKFDQSGE